MARQQSQIDLMHVPTPAVVIDRLRAMLAIPDGSHVFDPCCGTGEALRTLAPASRAYGIELDTTRAAFASKRLDGVLACAMQQARVSHNTFGLMLLNPPYADGLDGRLEADFLSRCTKHLVPGGVLVFIIKHDLYHVVTKILRRRYEIVGHWRFPDGWYDGPSLSFGQTVLIARRLANPCDRPVDQGFLDQLNLNGLEPIPDEWTDPIAVPEGLPPDEFLTDVPTLTEIAAMLRESTVKRFVRTPQVLGCGRPPLPLKQGHIALALASGRVNGVYGSGGERHVAKGMVVRRETETHEMETSSDGSTAVVCRTLYSFDVEIRVLLPDGTIRTIGPPAPVATAEDLESQ